MKWVICMGRNEQVPIWEKPNLTLDEAASYFNIGVNRLRDMSNEDDCDFVIWIGNKRLFKRRKLEEYLESQYSL